MLLGIPHMTAQLQMMDQNANAVHQGNFKSIKEEFFYQNLGNSLAKHDVIKMKCAARVAHSQIS